MTADRPTTEPRTEAQLDELEARMAEAQATVNIMLAMKMVEDGHAPNAGAAGRMIRDDLDAVLALYGEGDDA
jgi:hypothetical protein